jgi:hypothetical protein
MKNIIFVFFLFFLTANSNCFSESNKIYSWTDEKGVRHFSDTPTYGVEQESRGTAPFPVDRHGREQIPDPQKMIGNEALKNPSINKAAVQQTKPKLKSGGGQLNLNIIQLVAHSFLPIIYTVLLVILVFTILKLFVSVFLLKGSNLRKNIFQLLMSKKYDSGADPNSTNKNSPEFKGFEGEQIVIDLLYRYLDREKYHFFNDLILPEKEGTTQIDHLIVSEYGIFIIETKNMKGSIYGNPNEKYWTQWLADGKHPFQNPIRQNYKHKKCLEELLKIKPDIYFEVVVFMEHANFPKGKPDCVFYPKEFIQFVKSQTKKILFDNEISTILSIIDDSRIEPSFETDKRHKEYVKSLFDEK